MNLVSPAPTPPPASHLPFILIIYPSQLAVQSVSDGLTLTTAAVRRSEARVPPHALVKKKSFSLS